MARRSKHYKHTERGYESYERLYKERKSEMEKRGLVMADTMYTRAEYEYYAAAEREGRKKEISQGSRKKIGDVNRSLVTSQSYAYSIKQGKAIQKAVKATIGVDLKLYQARDKEMAAMFWDEVSDRNELLKASGFTGKERAKIIAQDFFGSP